MINKILGYIVRNKKFPNKQTGQILIIFLLILVVGLAIVLSVASRSITDIRTATTSDESSRAYFAAEAGVEEALKRLESNPSFTKADIDFSTVNQTRAKVSASELEAGTAAFLLSDNFAKDSVEQISLLEDFNDITTNSLVPLSTDPETSILQVWWDDDSGVKSAIEVTVVGYKAGSPDKWSIAKFAFDPDSARQSGNKFCKPEPDLGVSSVNGLNFRYTEQIDIRTGYLSTSTECAADVPGIADNFKPVLARVKLLYNDSPDRVAVKGVGWNLPTQGVEIESTGEHVSGVTRKLKVTQRYPSLPAIFDYVLFSGGNLTKN